MANKVITVQYGNETDILIAPELAFALPCVVGNAGVTANSEGKKIIKAGTPLYAAQDWFMNRQTVLTVDGATCYGYARHDIDVTAGDENDTLLIDGYVDYLKLDADVQAKVTSVISADTTKARVRFIKGRKD